MPEPCTHHWLLPSPEGETVMGRCKRCGATREFASAMPEPTVAEMRTTSALLKQGKIAMEYVDVTKGYQAW